MSRVVEEKKNDNKIKVYIFHMYIYIPIRRTDALSLQGGVDKFPRWNERPLHPLPH